MVIVYEQPCGYNFNLLGVGTLDDRRSQVLAGFIPQR